MWGKKGNLYRFISKPTPPTKKLEVFPTQPHASLVIFIHNVQFQILSWGMILPQKFTSNTFYWFPHRCGIILYRKLWNGCLIPPAFATDFFLHPTNIFWMVPKLAYISACLVNCKSSCKENDWNVLKLCHDHRELQTNLKCG